LGQILFKIGKNVCGDFADVVTGLWRGLFEPYAMSRVSRSRPQIWTAFHVNGRRSVSEVLDVICKNRRLTVREVAEEVRICKSSCPLILTDKLQVHSVSVNFLQSMRRLLSPSPRVLNTVYIYHEICHIIMKKVEWICTCRANDCTVFNQRYNKPFWNWSTVCIIDRDLLGPRTRGKVFNLSIVTG